MSKSISTASSQVCWTLEVLDANLLCHDDCPQVSGGKEVMTTRSAASGFICRDPRPACRDYHGAGIEDM